MKVPRPQPQQCQIWSVSVTYITPCGNDGSLRQWSRPGIEPASSWILKPLSHNRNFQLLIFKNQKFSHESSDFWPLLKNCGIRPLQTSFTRWKKNGLKRGDMVLYLWAWSPQFTTVHIFWNLLGHYKHLILWSLNIQHPGSALDFWSVKLYVCIFIYF